MSLENGNWQRKAEDKEFKSTHGQAAARADSIPYKILEFWVFLDRTCGIKPDSDKKMLFIDLYLQLYNILLFHVQNTQKPVFHSKLGRFFSTLTK